MSEEWLQCCHCTCTGDEDVDTFPAGVSLRARKVRTTWGGASIDGMKLIELAVRCMAGSNSLPAGIVSSPHLRNAENARGWIHNHPEYVTCDQEFWVALLLTHELFDSSDEPLEQG